MPIYLRISLSLGCETVLFICHCFLFVLFLFIFNQVDFSYAVFFKTNHRVVAYHHNEHATIVPMGISFLEGLYCHLQTL